jgi:hypothetical protein
MLLRNKNGKMLRKIIHISLEDANKIKGVVVTSLNSF